MVRVLIVEDNADMRQTLSDYLSSQGFSVRAVDSVEDAIDEVDEHDFDIGLVDINLPGKSGFSLIEYVREQNNSMPLVAVTARGAVTDKLQGFELGVTDYVVKPFNLQELVARMRAHTQRLGPSNDTADLITASFALSPVRHTFAIRGRPVELTNTEFRIMQKLMMAQGSVVATDDLIDFVWGGGDSLERPPIRIHIANTRRKIGDTDFKIIKTIAGIGYRLDDQPKAHNA